MDLALTFSFPLFIFLSFFLCIGYKLKYHANGKDKEPIEIDFTPPFRRIRLVPDLEAILGVKFPDLDTEGKKNKGSGREDRKRE